MRTCIGCRASRPQPELVRVVRCRDGTLAVGRTLPGRGAWLCAGSDACVELALKRNAFTRALRGPVVVPPEGLKSAPGDRPTPGR